MRLRWRGFEFPMKVAKDESSLTQNFGKFNIEPFEKGFGHTIGNSLRRVLLSSLEGAAVIAIKIDGVNHEFSTLPGVLEDMTEVVLNVKKIRLKYEGDLDKVIHIDLTGRKGEETRVTAGDIRGDSQVEILNKDQLICTLTDAVNIKMQLTVRRGRGYKNADDIQLEETIGVIPVAASFTPVSRVRYSVSETRVGQMTNYDKLEVEIWTDGSISPEMALVEAAQILRKHLNPFVQYGEVGTSLVSDTQRRSDVKAKQKLEEEFKVLLQMPVADLGLSVRCANCLDAENIKTVGELVQKSESYLLTMKNFGKTSLDEITSKLREHAARLKVEITLGMDVSEYLSKV
ncbi:MAG: DNA-directed RNA polymerase subunit alpha [Planctomycetota bacterium]